MCAGFILVQSAQSQSANMAGAVIARRHRVMLNFRGANKANFPIIGIVFRFLGLLGFLCARGILRNPVCHWLAGAAILSTAASSTSTASARSTTPRSRCSSGTLCIILRLLELTSSSAAASTATAATLALWGGGLGGLRLRHWTGAIDGEMPLKE